MTEVSRSGVICRSATEVMCSAKPVASKPPATEERPARALTRKEATARLGISLSAYKALIAREQLKEFHVGRRRLITEAEIERFLSSQ